MTMTVGKLLAHCWDYEFVSLETEDDVPLENMIIMEAYQMRKCLPEVTDLPVSTFFIGTRFVGVLQKSIPCLVILVSG